MLLGKFADFARVRRRYIVYCCLMLSLFFEMSDRFSVVIAMMEGMVKKDCQDPEDKGAFCWTIKTRALVQGAYFYGFTVHFITPFIAKRYTGFLPTYRFWLTVSGAIQFCYPTVAALSTELLIVTQVIRGLLAGMVYSFNFEYISKFSVGKRESKVFISITGAINCISNGSGGLLSGVITKWHGWRTYFYYVGVTYVVGLVLNLIFVQESPDKSWYLTDEEIKLMMSPNKEIAESNEETINSTTFSNNTDLGDPGSEDPPPPPTSLRSLLCRVYLLAFCWYTLAYNLVYFNILNVLPYYLNTVLDADPLFIANLNIGVTVLIAACTIGFSFLFQRLDRTLPWLHCRMLFTLLPMVVQAVLSICFSLNSSVIGGLAIIIISAIACATFWSGSLATINYELDPDNSSLLFSIFAGFSQMAGFSGPIFMAEITKVDKTRADYDEVYKERWGYFFYMMSGVALSGVVVIVLAYIIRPGEWVKKSEDQGQAK